MIFALTGYDVDDDPLTFTIVTPPSNGALSGTAPDLTYTPDPDFLSTDSFDFIVNDGRSNSTAATVMITVVASDALINIGTITNNGDILVNTSNFTNSGTFNIQCDGILTGTLKSGNAPVDACTPVAAAQSISTSEDNDVAFTLNGTNPDADPDFASLPLQFSVVTGPSDGSLTGTNSSLTYTPNANFTGTDSFTFIANDGTNDSAPATISIIINAVNDAPVANAGTGQTVQAGVPVTLDGSASSDAESGITYSWTQTAGTAVTLSGATAVSPMFTSPPVSSDTVLTFRLIVNDGTADSAPDTVNVTVQAPSNNDNNNRHSGGGGNREVIVNPQTDEPSIEGLPESYFAIDPLGRIRVSNLAFLDALGVSINSAVVGQQVSITGTLANYLQVPQDYVFIVQITNEQDIVSYLSWQQGTVASSQTADVSMMWTPEQAGNYAVKVFVWDGMRDLPLPLSTVTVHNIAVTG